MKASWNNPGDLLSPESLPCVTVDAKEILMAAWLQVLTEASGADPPCFGVSLTPGCPAHPCDLGRY